LEDQILFRLVLDDKIVGYELHMLDEDGCSILHSINGKEFFNICLKDLLDKFIEHNKKELCLNPKADPKDRLFVGDIVENDESKEIGSLEWSNYRQGITFNSCGLSGMYNKIGTIHEQNS
jgi:hypothetical protein